MREPGVTEAFPRNDGSGRADFCSVLLTVTAQLLSVSMTVVALIKDFFKYDIPRRIIPMTKAKMKEVTTEHPKRARNVPRHKVKRAVDVCFWLSIPVGKNKIINLY